MRKGDASNGYNILFMKQVLPMFLNPVGVKDAAVRDKLSYLLIVSVSAVEPFAYAN